MNQSLPMDALLQAITDIAVEAGRLLMDCYRQEGLVVDWKDDASPVTAADRAAHVLIDRALSALPGHFPVLSEEGEIPEWEVRRHWSRYWLVDPLDGTREFIEGTGDFAVHIALIDHGCPILGVVHQPARSLTWAGKPGSGAWRREEDGPWQSLWTRPVGEAMTVVCSRSRPGSHWPELVTRLQASIPIEEQRYGGSVKYCRIAAGLADLYPCLVPVCEWDTAAPQAVLEGAGGVVRDAGHRPLAYNRKPDLRQPLFYAAGDARWPWPDMLEL